MAANTSKNGERQGGRILGFTETVDHHFLSKESVGVYWHIGIIQTTDELQDVDVITACKILVRKQEVLQMCIVPSENNADFLFKPMDDQEKIDYESITLKNKNVWPVIISQDHDARKIDCLNGPLWRFIFCRVEETDKCADFPHEYVVLIKLHHAICDGKSAFDMLYRQYLPILSALINGAAAENIIPFVPQTKSVEELFLTASKLANPLPWYIKFGVDLYRWKNRICKQPDKRRFMFPDEGTPVDEDLRSEPVCIPKVYDKEICDAVLRAAKSHGVTVHTVLLSAGAVAFRETADAAGIAIPETITQMWPIDLRKFLTHITPQPLGDIHSSAKSLHRIKKHCTKAKFWDSCMKLNASVKAESELVKCTKFLGITKYFKDVAQHSDLNTVLSEMGYSPHLSLSNLGNTSTGPEPTMTDGPVKVRLTEHFFTVSGVARLNVALLIQYMVTFERKFMYVVIHNPLKVSETFVEAYLNKLEDVLKTFCGQDQI